MTTICLLSQLYTYFYDLHNFSQSQTGCEHVLKRKAVVVERKKDVLCDYGLRPKTISLLSWTIKSILLQKSSIVTEVISHKAHKSTLSSHGQRLPLKLPQQSHMIFIFISVSLMLKRDLHRFSSCV